MYQVDDKRMRFLFSFFAFLSILSVLLLGASVFIETRSGYGNFALSDTTLTVNFSGIDRILLGLAIVCGIFTFYFWQRFVGRR